MHNFKQVFRPWDEKKHYLPLGWTAMLEIHFTFETSFFVSSCFVRLYTLIKRWVLWREGKLWAVKKKKYLRHLRLILKQLHLFRKSIKLSGLTLPNWISTREDQINLTLILEISSLKQSPPPTSNCPTSRPPPPKRGAIAHIALARIASF